MKYWKKLVAAGLTMSMLAAGLTGCGNTQKTTEDTNTPATTVNNEADVEPEDTVEAVSLKVWVPEEDQEITKEMVDTFAENHPEYDLSVEVSVMGVDNTCDELKKDLDVAADIFLYPSGAVAELTEAGLLYPITVGAEDIMGAHGEASIRSCTGSDGYLYGVPVTPNSWFMYYNKSMYTEDEVKSLETMMAKDLGEGIANFSCAISNSWYMSAFFYGAGGTLYGANGDDPTECSWNDETGYKVGEYLIDLANNDKYVEDIDGVGANLFKEGKVGAYCSGTWSAGDLQAALGDNYAACKLPTININGADCQLSNFADFKAFGIKSSTAYPKAAQELAAWLGGEECQLIRYETNQTTPTVMALADNEAVKADLATCALTEQTNYSTPNPTTSQLDQYWGPAGAFGSGVVYGDITRDNLQESLDAMVEGFLSTLTDTAE